MNGPATTSRDPENILALGAGAPHSPLMAGALWAISCWRVQNKNRPLRTISTAGGVPLMGILFLAPKHDTSDEALQSVVEFGVADAIYRLVPIGFKTFFKPGPFTAPFRRAAGSVKDVAGPLGTAWVRAGMELLGGS